MFCQLKGEKLKKDSGRFQCSLAHIRKNKDAISHGAKHANIFLLATFCIEIETFKVHLGTRVQCSIAHVGKYKDEILHGAERVKMSLLVTFCIEMETF